MHRRQPLPLVYVYILLLFFFNDTAATEIYTLSLHDALPICLNDDVDELFAMECCNCSKESINSSSESNIRSEEHTSELQSRENLVCRLLLEKKKRAREDNVVLDEKFNQAKLAGCSGVSRLEL